MPDRVIGPAGEQGLEVSRLWAVFAAYLNLWGRQPAQPDIAVACALRGNHVRLGGEPSLVEQDRFVDAARRVQVADKVRREVPEHERLILVPFHRPLVGAVRAAMPDLSWSHARILVRAGSWSY